MAAAGISLVNQLQAAEPESESSEPLEVVADQPTRIRVMLELDGHLKVRDLGKNKIHEVPLEAKSELQYDEQIVRTNRNEVLGSTQHIHLATVENRVDGQSNEQALRTECNQILRVVDEPGLITGCETQPLTTAETDLVSGPIATLFIDKLLPSGAIRKNETWSPTNETIRQIFGLDTVQESTVRANLVEIKADIAVFEFDGKITAFKAGVPTALAVKGRGQIDRKSSIISWLAISIQEDRDISIAKPGFSLTARIRILRKQVPTMAGPASPVDAILDSNREQLKLVQWISSKGHYQFLGSNKWNPIRDNGIFASFRMIEDNRFVAQCNVTNLPDMEPGLQLTLEGFQMDLKASMGENFGDFEAADEKVTSTGLRLLRIVTVGEIEGNAVRWVNVHLSNDDGRHLNFVFTMNAGNALAFGAADEQIVDSVEFLERPEIDPSTDDQVEETAQNTESANR
jgi:hypothetical protein